MTPARQQDEGFTLVELLVAMLIMIVITVPLVTSFVVGLRATTESKEDVTNSTDAQVLAGFFDVDVAGSDTVRVDSASSCGSAGTVALTVTWTDATVPHVVSYRFATDSDAEAELHVSPVYALQRYQCDNGTAQAPVYIARQLAAAPTLLCDGKACGAGALKPRTVSMQLQGHAKLLRNQSASTDRFDFGVTATRKVTAP